MKRSISFTTAIWVALLALLFLTHVVRSGSVADQMGSAPGSEIAHLEPARLTGNFSSVLNDIQATGEYSLTRIVTVTVGSSTVPLTPGLNSRWQINTFSQDFLTGTINLPSDVSDIAITLINGDYSIDYPGSTIYITNSQGLYYEYRTDQQALRYGNQILISQTYRYNRPFHYVGTVIFTAPYQYVGVAGYAPGIVNANQLHWDKVFTETRLNTFEAATWLVRPDLPKPDLEILTATLVDQSNHVYVAATIRNSGFEMATGAPAYLNLYDRLAPSTLPTGPLDLANSWCSGLPFSLCGGMNNPLPTILPNQVVFFTTEFEITATGQHDIYLFIDALGGNQGLNVESVENNNLRLVGSVIKWNAFVFLPLIQR